MILSAEISIQLDRGVATNTTFGCETTLMGTVTYSGFTLE